MRIVFVTAWQDPQTSASGAARVSYEIASAFHKYSDHEILFVSPGDKHNYFRGDDGLLHLEIQSIGDEAFMFPNLDKENVNFLSEKLTEFNPDLIHSHTESFLGTSVQLWANKNRVPFVHTIHFTPTEMSQFQVTSKTTRVLFKLVDKLKFVDGTVQTYLNNCDLVISLNEYIKEDLREFGYKNLIEIIPNGRDIERLSKLPLFTPDLRKRVNLFFVGEISERKNQIYLIEVMKYLPNNYFLKLIGVGKDKSYIDEINSIIEENNLQERIEFAGKIPYEEMPNTLSAQHICVSAAKYEVQSLAILESLAAGKPIVSLENHTTNELIIPENEVGYKFPWDEPHNNFADAIINIAENPELYKKLSKNSKALAQQFSWENVVKKTENAYLNLMEKFNRPQQTKIKPIYLQLSPDVNQKQFDLLKSVFFLATSFFGTSVVYRGWNSWRRTFKKKSD